MDRSKLLHQLADAEWNVFQGAWRLAVRRNAVRTFRPFMRPGAAALLKCLERQQMRAVREALQLRSQFKLLLELPHKTDN